MTNTYWNHAGKYQELVKQLEALVPIRDECPKDKPSLEKFRKASNCYYDLYNNGLCNRKAEFTRVFGFKSNHTYGQRVSAELQDKLERAMNRIILMAAAENLEIEVVAKKAVVA